MKKCLLVLIAFTVVLLQGCSSNCRRETDLAVKTTFNANQPVHIIVNTQPYEVTEAALSSLCLFFSDSLGLETEVSRMNLEGISKSDPTLQDIFNAAVPVLKEAEAPTLVIFIVRSIRDFGGGGILMVSETTYESGEHYPVAVVALKRGMLLEKRFESYLLKHEVGHWAGIPAYECHALSNNRVHCSSMRCVMMPGPASAPLRCAGSMALSLLCLRLPDFCEDCKRELAEMKKLHAREPIAEPMAGHLKAE